jgi:pyruvate dehydrogenase E2 component (dihydrolipoamide acetyltransferase)
MTIVRLGMPKFGLLMKEGTLAAWLVEDGAAVTVGDGIAEVETDKINGVFESPGAGILRRRVARVGDVVPVGALIGVLADPATPDAEIDAFVTLEQASFVPEDEAEKGPQTETVQAETRVIRYLRHGDGDRTVVLIHGFGGDLTAWLFNQEALARPGWSVYALDLPGHGGSSKDAGDGTVDELARAVLAALEALGLSHAHLVGHSLGGAVAVEVATLSPTRVASLALIAPVGLGSEIDGDFLDGFVAAESRRELRPVLERLFADPDVATRQLAEEVLRTKRVDGVEKALRAIAGACFTNGRQAVDVRERLAALGLPTLVVWGAEDRIVPAAHASTAAGSRVEIVASAGHMPQLEAPAEVNRLLIEHLESASA